MTSSLYDVSGGSNHLIRCTVRSPCEAAANVIKNSALPISHVMYRLKFKTQVFTHFLGCYIVYIQFYKVPVQPLESGWHVYDPENGYSFSYPRLLRVKGTDHAFGDIFCRAV